MLCSSPVASAILIEDTHADSWSYAHKGVSSFGGGSFGSHHAPAVPTISIERFNPLLGELLAVDMYFTFMAQSSLTVDCQGVAFHCLSDASGGGAHVILFDRLGSDSRLLHRRNGPLSSFVERFHLPRFSVG